MSGYDRMLMICDDIGLDVQEKPLQAHDGMICGRHIAIRKDIRTRKQKSEVLAEELAHFALTAGNILDQSDENNQRQERKARDLAFDIKIGLDGLVSAYKAGCRSFNELAEYFDCTDEYLSSAIERYHQKYGLYAKCGDYVVTFEPLSIGKIHTKGYE